MLIMSYDKKRVIKARTLYVTKNFTGKKDEKWALVAETERLAEDVVAVFPDEKTAVDALQKAFAAFSDGAVSYRFD